MAKPRLKSIGIVNIDFGQNVTIVQPSNLYCCHIGTDCFIGPFVEIQQGVIIGRGTKIQSHAFVRELFTIGKDCVIAHRVMFINDLFQTGGPAKGDQTLWRPTQIGNWVAIGSNATILPVCISDDVVIGAGAVLTQSIVQAGIYAGNPARLLRKLK